ncbi:unnamed protein product, partial [Prorocentrum cordatum]
EEEEEEEEKEEGGRGIDRDAYCAVDRLSKFDRLQTCHKPNAASRMRNTYCSKLQGRTRTRLGGLQRCAKKKLPLSLAAGADDPQPERTQPRPAAHTRGRARACSAGGGRAGWARMRCCGERAASAREGQARLNTSVVPCSLVISCTSRSRRAPTGGPRLGIPAPTQCAVDAAPPTWTEGKNMQGPRPRSATRKSDPG